MSNAFLAVAYAPVPGFPAGTTVASISATITGQAAGNTTPILQTGAPGVSSIEFVNVVPDTYTYSVVAVTADGNPLGTAVTGTFTITAPTTVSLSLPSAVSVTQQ